MTQSGRDSFVPATGKGKAVIPNIEMCLGFLFFGLIGIFYFVLMITVYVIESLQDETWYTGIAIDAVARLKEHNAGKNRFTKGHRPWKIIYAETQSDWMSARQREPNYDLDKF